VNLEEMKNQEKNEIDDILDLLSGPEPSTSAENE
jgi:hypothetical protein